MYKYGLYSFESNSFITFQNFENPFAEPLTFHFRAGIEVRVYQDWITTTLLSGMVGLLEVTFIVVTEQLISYNR